MHLLWLSLLGCSDKENSCSLKTWTIDQDGDGYAGTATVDACDRPSEATNRSGDCNDDDPLVNPDATERCNGVDDDCDGAIDPPASRWYTDADGDGYGDQFGYTDACEAPEGAVDNDQDCDDSRGDVYPGAAETWYDGIDQDCLRDDDWDADDDGHATPDGGGGDCDDQDRLVHPDGREICHNGVDDDCDADPSDCELSGLIPMTRADWRIDGKGAGRYDYLGYKVQGIGPGSPFTDRPLFALTQLDWAGGDLGHVYLYSLEDDGPAEQTRIVADDRHQLLGHSFSHVGDLNGDGHVDFTAASDNGDSPSKADLGAHALTFFGPFAREIDANDYDQGWWGNEDLNGLGQVMIGPLVGEGMDGRLAISAYGQWFYNADGTASGTGAVYLLDPPFATDTYLTGSEHYIQGENNPNGAAYEMVTTDANGDGVSDITLYVGVLGVDDRRSMVATFLGPITGARSILDHDGALITDSTTAMGIVMDQPGDLDGDGVDEIVLGAPHDTVDDEYGEGAAYILSTPDLLEHSAPDDHALARIVGRAGASTDLLGSSLSHGDFNNDGQTDLLIGAYFAAVPDGAGAKGVVYGFHHLPRGVVTAWTEADFQITGTVESGRAGWAISADMDLDVDGCDDLLVSDPFWPAKKKGYGSVGIFLGGCE